jgi:hypothetical protein
MKRVVLYIRVSTSRQDTENQRWELVAVADRSGWKIVKVYENAGIQRRQGQGSTSCARRDDEGSTRRNSIWSQHGQWTGSVDHSPTCSDAVINVCSLVRLRHIQKCQ